MTDNVPTGRELEALKVLWTRGKATVREIYQEMKPRDGDGELAYTTVLSLLQTMEQKGLVGHESAGKAYVYCPLVQRENTFRKLAGGFLDQVFDGALGEYVARALQSRHPSLKELEELERMIGEAKKKLEARTSRSKEEAVLASRFTTLEHWLADLYLLSTVLLLAGLAIMRLLKQPARRIVVARSIAMGLAGLAMVASAPSWPRIAAVGWQAGVAAPAPRVETQPPMIETATTNSVERNAMNIAIGQPVEPAVVPPQTRTDAPAPNPLLAFAGLRSWRSMLVVVFTIGAAINLAWLALGAVQATLLRCSSRAATPRIQPLAARISREHPSSPRVGLSSRVGLPVAIGMVRPMIVLPLHFAENEPDDCLEAALAHEWAHIRNGDLRWLALLRLLNVVLFAQPLFWRLRRTIRADQEVLADAAASALHGDGRVAYAETLVAWARSSYRPQPGAIASAALALWERPSMLHRRVRLLLDREYRVEETAPQRWKLAASCAGLLTTLLLSMVTLRPSVATAHEMKEAKQVTQNPSADASRSAKPGGDRFEYAGQVLDPEGKPFAGAKLHLAYFGYTGQAPPPIQATSDSGGQFLFAARKEDFVDTTLELTAQVVATADGFGLGWADASASQEKTIDPRDLTIRLRRDDAPLTGRILDLEGRPLSGVTVRPGEILEPIQGDLSAFIAASTDGKGGSHELEREYLKRKLWPRMSGLPIEIVTDFDGQFSIRGVGAERLLRLRISGPTVQFKEFNVLTRSSSPFQVTAARGSPDWGIALYYGANFTHAAAPTKPVFGVVKDKDTGKPLVGVRIECNKTAEFPVHGLFGIEATTDEQGRYRLVGMPKGRGNQVIAIPASGQPYLATGFDLPDSPGLDPVSFDIALKHGVVIEGRVIDKKTGEPLEALVEYHAYRDNPNLGDAVGFDRARQKPGNKKTTPDGSYRLIGLPGHGLVAAVYTGRAKQYLKGTGLPGGDVPGGMLPIVPGGMMWEFNVLSEVKLTPTGTTHHIDLALETGLTRTVRVLDPEGRALAGARIKFQAHVFSLSPPQPTPEFLVESLRADEIRPLLAFHEERKLAGHVEIKANEQGFAELKLQPWATLLGGRLVDVRGNARTGVDIVQFDREGKRVTTDSQGRFRVDGLVPGKAVDVWVSPNDGYVSGTVAKGLVLKPGEVKDLGDVREKQ